MGQKVRFLIDFFLIESTFFLQPLMTEENRLIRNLQEEISGLKEKIEVLQNENEKLQVELMKERKKAFNPERWSEIQDEWTRQKRSPFKPEDILQKDFNEIVSE